ncbi:MAG: aspartate aminotransferase family protein [bacterium]|nr:aspartate aminotransferase family protein [bacterium]
MPKTQELPTFLPEKGRSWQEVEADLLGFQAMDLDEDVHLRLLTGIHKGDERVHEVCRKAYFMYFHTNAVLAEYHPGQGRIQREVLEMAVRLLGGGAEGRANITSGGTESIMCAMHTAREWARATRPDISEPYQIVMPRTAHATFDKAAHYLGMELVRVPVGADLRADVDALEAAITPRTLVLVGSAPCWGFGLLDPIHEIAALAERHDLWMHTDCCVGGFLLPFMERLGIELTPYDFRVPGVKSISADLHKHGYAAKPCSTVLYRNEELQQHHWTGVAISDWQSGMYRTQGVIGSRPMAAVAAAWAVMNFLGEDGYVDLARRSLEVKDRLVAGIEAVEDFRCLPNESLLLPFRSETLDMLKVFGGLVEKGYFPWGTFDPIYVHPSAEPVDDVVVETFLADLGDIGKGVKDGTLTAEALGTYI